MSDWSTRARFAACLALLGAFRIPCAAALEPEDELKSAVVLTFLQYSQWPEQGFADGPVTLGVLGRPAFVQVLRRIAEGKSVNGHPIRIAELKTLADPRCCQVIYVATDKTADIRQALQSTRTTHALTIGEADRFLDYGGAVNLFLVGGHMSFEVSLDALERSGIVISSKLLRCGQIKGRRQP